MKQFLSEILQEALRLGSSYADVRFTSRRTESITIKDGAVQGVDAHLDYGIGVRVLVNGAWGFASNPDIDDKDRTMNTVKRAVELARASALSMDAPIRLAQKPVVVDEWEGPCVKDPFKIPLEKKLETLIQATALMKEVEGVAITEGMMDFYREEKHYMDSEGSFIRQKVFHSGAGIDAVCLLGGEVQQRSWPSHFRGNHQMGGYEVIEAMDFMSNAKRIAFEVVQLHKCPPCPAERMDLILGKSQLALQVHESCGHAVELDRVLGYEANFAGTSFLTLDKWKNFTYGSNKVNLYQDGTTPKFIGTWKYDDEGVPCCSTPIVSEGQFVGYLKSRDSAHFENGLSNGACRATGWQNIPIVRMTNIHLAPGQETLEQLISSTKRGIFMTDNSSWSIDDKRANFQFGCELAWLIENGKLTKMLKNPTYTGMTPEFWGACEGVAGQHEWEIWGTPNCGKGQPMQVARVGHGVSYAKFRNIKVGVA